MSEHSTAEARSAEPKGESLSRRFVRTAKGRWTSLAVADSTGRSLSYGRTLVASLLLARWLRRSTADDNIGLLLPASVGGALANLAATLAGKVPVNLNFTAGSDAIAHAVARCDIRLILTSRVFLSKAGLPALEGMVYLLSRDSVTPSRQRRLGLRGRHLHGTNSTCP